MSVLHSIISLSLFVASVSYKTGNFVPCIPYVPLLVVGLAMLGKSLLVSRQLRRTVLLASCGTMAGREPDCQRATPCYL